MKLKGVIFTLAVFLLTACNSEQAIAITPVPTASATNTATITAPVPTLILIPTETPSPIIQPTETIPVATLNAVATLDAAVQLCPGGRSPIYPPASFSPKGDWIAVVCLGEDIFSKFIKPDGTGYWEIPLTRIFHWSNDGNYAYLIPDSIDPKPSSPELLFVNGSSLYRLELESGNLTTTIENNSSNSYSFSFSPDDRFLIYSSHPVDFTVQLKDLYSGENIKFSLPDEYSRAGMFIWSQDGTKVVFTAAGKGDWYSFQSSFSIYLVDTEAKQITLLLNEPPHNYYADKWLSENKI